jgi:serine phosphatase RsbU (regulator of sigma subunit)
MMERTQYKSAVVDFKAGDTILVVTDGFTESVDPSGTLYGQDRIEQQLSAADPANLDLLRTLLQQVRSFEAGQPPADDTAAILLTLTRDKA